MSSLNILILTFLLVLLFIFLKYGLHYVASLCVWGGGDWGRRERARKRAKDDLGCHPPELHLLSLRQSLGMEVNSCSQASLEASKPWRSSCLPPSAGLTNAHSVFYAGSGEQTWVVIYASQFTAELAPQPSIYSSNVQDCFWLS